MIICLTNWSNSVTLSLLQHLTNASSIYQGWCGFLLPTHGIYYTQDLSKCQ
nr:MAG TPA: hypothetical protein [Caudoviricetes sp.]